MSDILGADIYAKLREESAFESSDAELILSIARDMKRNPEEWNGLGYLNSQNRDHWDNSLYRIIRLIPGNWEVPYSKFVAFIKILRNNWIQPIPELLRSLEPYEIGIIDFFKLERTVSLKFASLVKDVNTLQKIILKDKNYDIGRFVAWISHAFLPTVVYQLEEYGLPRMISKKIHKAKVIDFIASELNIERAIEQFRAVGINRILSEVPLDDFDKYIVNYFYSGISNSWDEN